MTTVVVIMVMFTSSLRAGAGEPAPTPELTTVVMIMATFTSSLRAGMGTCPYTGIDDRGDDHGHVHFESAGRYGNLPLHRN